MSHATMKVDGLLSADPVLRHTQNGTPVLGLKVPHTPRRLNKDTNQWEDAGETVWVVSSIWGDDAELYAPLVKKGARVIIEGEPSLNVWNSDGKSGVEVELKKARVSLIPRRPHGSTPPPPRPVEESGWYQGDDVPW